MTLPLILLAAGNLMLLLAIRSLRTRRLKERYALLFLAVGVPFLGVALWPDAIGFLAKRLEIEYPTVLLLGVTVFFLLMNFSLLSIVSVLERRIVSLAQSVAILQERVGRVTRADAPATRLVIENAEREKDEETGERAA